MENLDPRVLFDVVDLMGVLTNGILGGAVARQLRLDPVGFVVLAIASGLGGGMIRDTLLQGGFPVALTNSAYLATAILGAAVAFFLQLRGRWTNRILIVADALAMGCWAATGTSKALGAGLTWLPAIMLGVITAVGGGMIRDIAVGRVPMIFGGNTLYATGAVLGSAEMAVLYSLGFPNGGMAAAILTAAAVTVVARRRGWRLPGPGEWTVRLPRPEWPRPRFRRRGDEPPEETGADG
ncbi:trimeric intracellular cation channel family protein [Kocuria sp.]|jgi:uncharacterized membrane protein YeiH|uniref:trimeric intracellular cation channel family protein n=1 Tax=Kocuria sp. TaxID=1871328 RepID=UPI002811E543|nr:trimeric intracellular cation channel family protein [Kocuria sp.]HST72964.1 trimeric intracellular cation channel family protein [Kocuria rosea]